MDERKPEMCVQCVGLCSYCDCRSLPVVSRLSLEHAAILDLSRQVRQSVTTHPAAVGELLDQLLDLLVRHGSYEERSLYGELREDAIFAKTATDLCTEHVSIYGALRRSRRRAAASARLLPALDQLDRHITKEERGLFPPAVILLSSAAWERAAARE